MRNIKNRPVFFFIPLVKISILLLITSCSFAIARGEEAVSPIKATKAIEMLRSIDKPIEFYGKVIDQNKAPVKDAQVMVHVRSSTGIKKVQIVTNGNGLFELKGERGNLIFIDGVEKEGYSFSFKDNENRGFDYAAHFEKDRSKPDKTSPIIFSMRKKEAKILVIPGEFKLRFDQSTTELEVDLIEKKSRKSGRLGKSDKSEHVDLQIKAHTSEDKTKSMIYLRTPDENSGVIISNELLYIVPSEGYQNSQSIALPVSGNIVKHVYVKARGGNVYSRLDITLYPKKDKLSIEIMSWSNPNGSRNVDYHPDIYIDHIRKKNEESERRIMEREERNSKLKENR